jgi:RNA polymerase sigma factor (sigma-70 family)
LAILRFVQRVGDEQGELSDEELLVLFDADPERAWDLFIDRYAGLVLATLRHLGFDHDEAMDRFVYVCEKLCEQGFRRLRSIRFAGSHGELTPWVRTVVKNLAVSWAWSVEGRQRLFKSIAELSARERRVFELYFWDGLTPSQVHERLRAEEQSGVELVEVLDALEVVFSHLSENQRWRLMSRLARNRKSISLADEDPETRVGFEPRDAAADLEESLLRQERHQVVTAALAGLAPRERLILQLRYDEALTLAEVAEIVSLSLSAVKSSLRKSLDQLREVVGKFASSGDDACSV